MTLDPLLFLDFTEDFETELVNDTDAIASLKVFVSDVDEVLFDPLCRRTLAGLVDLPKAEIVSVEETEFTLLLYPIPVVDLS